MALRRTFDRTALDAFIARVHVAEGDASFMEQGIVQLEQLVRRHDSTRALPGKTLLRERLNAYRIARWPHLAPVKLGGHHRW